MRQERLWEWIPSWLLYFIFVVFGAIFYAVLMIRFWVPEAVLRLWKGKLTDVRMPLAKEYGPLRLIEKRVPNTLVPVEDVGGVMVTLLKPDTDSAPVGGCEVLLGDIASLTEDLAREGFVLSGVRTCVKKGKPYVRASIRSRGLATLRQHHVVYDVEIVRSRRIIDVVKSRLSIAV